MNSKQQLKVVSSRFELSNNKFFNDIANAVAKKISDDAGVKVQLIGRITKKGHISAVLLGNIDVIDEQEYKELEKTIQSSINDIKNPTDLLGMLK